MSKTKWITAGMFLALAGAWSLVSQQPTSAQQPTADPGFGLGSRQVVTHFETQQNGPTVLTVVDPQTHVVAVYHIARDTGEIKFKSVRNFELDLRLDGYNTTGLTAEQIRKMLDVRQQ